MYNLNIITAAFQWHVSLRYTHFHDLNKQVSTIKYNIYVLALQNVII